MLGELCIFSDVNDTHWAQPYIKIANEIGIINGYGNGIFGPEDQVTNEQALKMIVCALGYEETAFNKGGYPNGFIAVTERLNIVESCGITSYSLPSYRWQIAQMLYNALNIPVLNDKNASNSINEDNIQDEEKTMQTLIEESYGKDEVWYEEWVDDGTFDWTN